MTDYMPFHKILEFAESKHKGQTRRDGNTPYFIHVKRVVERVTNYQNEANWDLTTRKLAQVAALHDVLEDTSTTNLDLMKLHLLEDVHNAIRMLTKDKYDDYLEYIKLVNSDFYAKKVKIADILDNLSDNPTKKQIIKYARALLILHDVE